MLKRLEIKNYILIEALEIDFPEGLVIISGQTGAGKSILLGALSLLMGAKADASLISEGAESCVVEAEFSNPNVFLKTIIEDADAEWSDDSLILRRVISRAGRSRAFVNDCPFPVPQLNSLSSKLIDIHSQHQTLQLQNPSYQIDLLDYFAETQDIRKDYSQVYTKLNTMRSDLSKYQEQLKNLERERNYNQSQFNQLDNANLKEGELEDLEEEQLRLSHSEDISRHLVEAMEAMNSSTEEIPSIDSALKETVKALDKITSFIPESGQLKERIESARLELDDALSEISSLSDSIETSPDRLEQVESRMSQLYSLMTKYGCSNIKELIKERDRYSDILFDTGSLDDKIAELSENIKKQESILSDISSKLSQKRHSAAEGFASKLQDMIRSLELPLAIFEVDITTCKPSISGEDNVVFKFSSNSRACVPIAQCASGGEMSRIMLCMKAMMAKYVDMPTMIFDEIDTGVSGSVADKMGSMICKMGEDMQVFAITHLPQVAAKGNAHYLVSKSQSDSGVVTSTIGRLNADERVQEIARMLSGSSITDAAIANAKVLLDIF